jgi:ubiquinone/menaquinone biosynthesis C-methylase UbiE
MSDGLLAEATCPWWLIPTFDNPLRRWLHPAQRLLAPLVNEGDRVLEPGCGMGYFTLALARLVGPSGKVLALDIQAKMLQGVTFRAKRAGLSERIETQLCEPTRLAVTGPVDFALAFWMVHEVSHREQFLADIRDALRPGGKLLVVEPKIHVSGSNFDRTLSLAEGLGLVPELGPAVRLSRSALFTRS